MMRRKGSLAVVLVALVLLVAAEPAKAFGFCFSFGSKSHNRPHYNAYSRPYPGFAAPLYPAYGYSPVPPVYNYNNTYYPQLSPGVTAPPKPEGK
jgi:hypothetical protein